MKTVFIVSLVLFFCADVYIIIYFAVKKLSLFLKSSILSAIIVALLLAAICLLKIYVPYYVLILCLLVIFIHNFLGYYRNYYCRIMWFDRCQHIFGAFSFSLLFYYLLDRFIEYGGSRLFLSLYIALLGIAVGELFEIVEFITDYRKGTNTQKSLKDTDIDLMCNGLGSAIAGLFAYFAVL